MDIHYPARSTCGNRRFFLVRFADGRHAFTGRNHSSGALLNAAKRRCRPCWFGALDYRTTDSDPPITEGHLHRPRFKYRLNFQRLIE